MWLTFGRSTPIRHVENESRDRNDKGTIYDSRPPRRTEANSSLERRQGGAAVDVNLQGYHTLYIRSRTKLNSIFHKK